MTVPEADCAPYGARLRRTLVAYREAGVEALIVTHPPNLRYLTGFDGTMGALVACGNASALIVDGRYATAASRIAARLPDAGLRVERAERFLEDAIARVIAEVAVSSAGVEAHVMTLARFSRLAEAIGGEVRLVPMGPLVERLRAVKDPSEIAIFRTAAGMLSAVAREVLASVRAGRTERDVAAGVDAALRRAGFERPAFDTIVASGPNSALPHARPGGRRLEPSDGVVLDFGGVYGGYCVDLTRTVQLAPLTNEFGRLFEAVRQARVAALASVRPGAKASDVDAAARNVLAQHGLASAFVHGTGHGLGLEVHEAPRISSAATAEVDETLQPGMVLTIEPGAYVPGVGGVRLEDDVLVAEQGCELLTDVPIVRSGGTRPGAPCLAGE